MSRLPLPIERVLEPATRDEDVARGYRALVERRARDEEARRSGPWRALQVGLAGAAVVGAAAIAAVVVTPGSAPSGPIALASGAPPPASLVGAVAFNDGSSVAVTSGADVEVVDNTADRFVVVVRRGRTDFEVEPGGARRWVVEAGTVTVEVVGTEFSVERSGSTVRVVVTRGAVVCRGEGVPDRVVRLEAGDSLTAQVAPRARPPVEGAPAVSEPADDEPAPEPPPGDESPAAPSEVPERARPASEPAPEPSMDELFDRATDARLAGRLREARDLYEEITRQFPRDSRAALAGYSCARLELQLDRPLEAARQFAWVAAHPHGGRFAEQASARRVQALAAAGDAAAARVARREFEERYPTSTWLAEVERWAPGALP